MSHPFRSRPIRFLALIAFVSALAFFTSSPSLVPSATQEDAATPPCGCTSVLAGRLATTDGSTITSHTCDGGSRTWIEIVPHATHEPGELVPIWNKRIKRTEFVGDMRGLEALGEIPQAAETYQFVNPVYPCMNEYQLAMGETTIGGRRELRSTEGIFSIEELQKVVMARTRTARETPGSA